MRHEGRWEADELLGAIEAAEGAQQFTDSRPAPDVAAHEVTEASWEWFPASDAPVWWNHR